MFTLLLTGYRLTNLRYRVTIQLCCIPAEFGR